MTVLEESRPAAPEAEVLPLRCTDCGAEVLLVLPLSINDLPALLRAFERTHAECERLRPACRVAGQRQLDLFGVEP
jgi:hypothetical protein